MIETRSAQALLPVRLLRDRNRTGAYLSYLGLGIFIFGMFFFLTVFMQAVWGYSALKTGGYSAFSGVTRRGRHGFWRLCVVDMSMTKLLSKAGNVKSTVRKNCRGFSAPGHRQPV